MDERSPYSPPAAAVGDVPESPPATFRWRRVLAFAALGYFVVVLIAIAFGMGSGLWPEIFGRNLAEAAANARTVRFCAIGVAGFGLYLLFLRPLGHRRLAHAAALLFAFELLRLVIYVTVFRKSVAASLAWQSLAGHALIALLAVAVMARPGLRQSRNRPIPQRGHPDLPVRTDGGDAPP
jgi:hypothetical protein